MATHHGKLGVVKVGANTVGEVQEFSVTEQTSTVDDTQMGDTAETHLIGIASWTASIKASFDHVDVGQLALVNGAAVTLNLFPDGSTTGLHEITGGGTVTEIVSTINRSAVNSITFNVKGNGALSHTTAP